MKCAPRRGGSENLIYTLFSKPNNLSSLRESLFCHITLLPYSDDQKQAGIAFFRKEKNDEKMKKIFKTSKICIACLFLFFRMGYHFQLVALFVCRQAQYVGRKRIPSTSLPVP
jgi:hypothetical protein